MLLSWGSEAREIVITICCLRSVCFCLLACSHWLVHFPYACSFSHSLRHSSTPNFCCIAWSLVHILICLPCSLNRSLICSVARYLVCAIARSLASAFLLLLACLPFIFVCFCACLHLSSRSWDIKISKTTITTFYPRAPIVTKLIIPNDGRWGKRSHWRERI